MADFTPHKIAESIKKDLEQTIKHPIMKSFRGRLAYKSPKTAQQDEEAMIFLIKKMEMFANGWISCNLLRTSELLVAYNFLQKEREDFEKEKKEMREIAKLMNDESNALIRILKAMGVISEEKLNQLREMERQIQMIYKNE